MREKWAGKDVSPVAQAVVGAMVFWLFLLFDVPFAMAQAGAQPGVAEGNPELFKREMDLAENAPDRDSRVAHWMKALSYRPANPQNILIEIDIANWLAMHSDPKHNQETREKDALSFYEDIVRKYDPKMYDMGEPGYTVTSPLVIIPSAAVEAGSIYWSIIKDPEKARYYECKAMDCFDSYYRKRVADWTARPRPVEPDPNDPRNKLLSYDPHVLWTKAVRRWEERKKNAEKGDVLSPMEMTFAEEAVRQFAYSYGKQRPGEVPVVMNQIIAKYPGTPLAKIAQGHIDRAMQMAEKDLVRALPKEAVDTTPARTPARTPAPPAPAPKPAAKNTLPYWAASGVAIIVLAAAAFLILRRRRSTRPKPPPALGA